MTTKNSAEINVGYPVYGLRFINSKTLLLVGGGGEGNNGVPNKITAIKCHFNAPDKNRRLQKFREITLPDNEDSPWSVDVARVIDDDHIRYSIFIGCNQSKELIETMSINNNLRKYQFTDEEHLRFADAVQYDQNVTPESSNEYPKVIHLSPENTVGALMTLKVPLEIFIFNPETLQLILHYKPQTSGEVKDFHLSGHDEGKALVYVTSSAIEAVSTYGGTVLSTTKQAPAATAKKLSKYIFSKVRYIGENKVVVTATLKTGNGAAIFEYDLALQKVTKERVISKRMKNVVAIDISKATGIIACAGNDCSVYLVRVSDLKVVKTYPNIQNFVITDLTFAPNGKRLATGSAANTINVVNIPDKIGKSGSLIGTLFQYLIFILMAAGLAIFVQNAKETGDLDKYIELSKLYGGEALTQAQIYGEHYGKIALDLSKKYGDEYYHKAQHYGQIGYEILKEKSAEGIDLLKEKLNKDKEASWVDTAESAATEIASTVADMVTEVTEDVDQFTSGLDDVEIDTKLIIDAAKKQTIQSSAETVSEKAEETKAAANANDKPETVPEPEFVEPEVAESEIAEPEIVESDFVEHSHSQSLEVPSSEVQSSEVGETPIEVEKVEQAIESPEIASSTASESVGAELEDTEAGTIPEATAEADEQAEVSEIASAQPAESEEVELVDKSAVPVPEIEIAAETEPSLEEVEEVSAGAPENAKANEETNPEEIDVEDKSESSGSAESFVEEKSAEAVSVESSVEASIAETPISVEFRESSVASSQTPIASQEPASIIAEPIADAEVEPEQPEHSESRAPKAESGPEVEIKEPAVKPVEDFLAEPIIESVAKPIAQDASQYEAVDLESSQPVEAETTQADETSIETPVATVDAAIEISEAPVETTDVPVDIPVSEPSVESEAPAEPEYKAVAGSPPPAQVADLPEEIPADKIQPGEIQDGELKDERTSGAPVAHDEL